MIRGSAAYRELGDELPGIYDVTARNVVRSAVFTELCQANPERLWIEFVLTSGTDAFLGLLPWNTFGGMFLLNATHVSRRLDVYHHLMLPTFEWVSYSVGAHEIMVVECCRVLKSETGK